MSVDKHGGAQPVPARQLIRLLRALEIAGGSAKAHQGAEDRVAIRHGGRELTFPASLVGDCRRDGLVRREADTLHLEPEGLSRLRRLQFPDMAFQGQHAELARRRIELPSGCQSVLVNEAESPVQRLSVRKGRNGKPFLSQAQSAAANRLRHDFEQGRLQPRMGVRLDGTNAGRSRSAAVELSDFALDARRRVERALDCLERDLAGVALDVCCFLKGLEQVERERQWPPRSAKLMLRTALSVLACHYGLDARAAGRRRAILQWGDETYRPSL